jgi:two-component system cell cycle sensor histidine kinase/response regulator CckA
MSKTILVVDDDEHIRAVAEEFLVSVGYAVLATGDPSRAIQIAREQPVDLLLSDVVMPLMRGTELADRVQAVRPSTKVLLMSGYVTGDVTGRAFITKPFALDDLARLVCETLTRPSPFARLTKAPSTA